MTKIQCANCKSFKTFNPRTTYIAGGIVFTLLSVPWVFIIIGIPFLIAGIGITIAGFTQPKGIKCSQCDNRWLPKN